MEKNPFYIGTDRFDEMVDKVYKARVVQPVGVPREVLDRLTACPFALVDPTEKDFRIMDVLSWQCDVTYDQPIIATLKVQVRVANNDRKEPVPLTQADLDYNKEKWLNALGIETVLKEE